MPSGEREALELIRIIVEAKLNAMKIELLYFEDCPSWKNALQTLNSALEALNPEMHVALVRVETQEEAEEHRFVGSPTIRVNGQDLFPVEQEQFALGCRIYHSPDGLRGWPDDRMLKERLRPLISVGRTGNT